MPMFLHGSRSVGADGRSTAAALLVAAAVGLASCSRSQTATRDCERAIEVVQRGQTSQRDAWAWSTLPGCGAAGASAAGAAWNALRATPDTVHIAQMYGRVTELRDSSLFETSRALLLDRAATAESRVFSAMLLVTQLIEHAAPDYRVYSTTGSHDVCTIASVTDRTIRIGTPLPSNASEQARSTALRVMTYESDPASVRNAARCMYDALQREDPVYARTPSRAGGAALVTESAGRLDTGRVRPAADVRRRLPPKRRPRVRAPADSVRRDAGVAGARVCSWYRGSRVHDGTLRTSPRGDVLETPDGRRLPVANLPRALEKADGARVWIAEPLGAPANAGIVDPSRRAGCAE